jgi:hypothetical protein
MGNIRLLTLRIDTEEVAQFDREGGRSSKPPSTQFHPMVAEISTERR